MPIGVVTGIFRDGDPLDSGSPEPYVRAVISTGQTVQASYSGTPPPLLVPSWFRSEDNVWYCEGPYGVNVQPVLREHFLKAPTASADGVVACDTSWNLDVNGVSSSLGALASSGLGVARLTSGPANGSYAQIYKDDLGILPSSADAFWIQAKVSLGSIANVTSYFGLIDLAATDQLIPVFSVASANWQMQIRKDSGTAVQATSATAAAASTYVVIEVLYAPSDFAAFWVAGDGPYYLTSQTTTQIPAGSDAIAPLINITSTTTASKTLDVDYYFLDAIHGSVLSPLDAFLTGVR